MVAQHQDNDSKHSQCSLVFCDTLTHSSVAEHVDYITFAYPITIKQFRVIAKDHNPHPRKLNFHGCTQPKSFWITVFSKQQILADDNWHTKSRNQESGSSEYFSFAPIAHPFPYKEAIEDTFVPLKECITDTIAIRGSYQALSFCIYGLICAPAVHSPFGSPTISFGSTPFFSKTTSINETNSPTLSLVGSISPTDTFYEEKLEMLREWNESTSRRELLDCEIDRQDDKTPKVHVSAEHGEDAEGEDDIADGFLNPLDCNFGLVNSVLGANSNSNSLSLVALCLMAFCNLLRDENTDENLSHTKTGLRSICALLERIAFDSQMEFCICEDRPENEALNNSVLAGILDLFSLLDTSYNSNGDDWPLRANPLLLLKTTCAAITISMRASPSFAHEFLLRGGMEYLMRLQQSSQFGHSCDGKFAILNAIIHSVAHPQCMSLFLYEKIMTSQNTLVMEEATVSHADPSNMQFEQREEPLSGYEFIVKMLTNPQTPQITQKIQEVLNLANLYESITLIQASVEIASSDSVSSTIVTQLQTVAEFVAQYSIPKRDKDTHSIPRRSAHKTEQHFVMLLHEMKFVHLLALLISSSLVRNSTGHSAGVYAGIKNCLLPLLSRAAYLKLLLDANSDVLALLVRSLVSLSDCDFTSGDLKPCIQFSDLLPLPTCLANPESVTPLNLAFLLAYHLQSLCEFESLYDASSNNYLDDEVGTLHSLYCMTFQDLGRYAVASSLAMALSSDSTSCPSLNMSAAPLDEPAQYIDHILREVTKLNEFLDSEASTINTNNAFMQVFRHYIGPPPDGLEVQTVPTVYAISLVLLAVQYEELTDFVPIWSTIYQVVSLWESKSSINAELKGRINQILDWLRPMLTLQESGVERLIQTLNNFVLHTKEKGNISLQPQKALATPVSDASASTISTPEATTESFTPPSHSIAPTTSTVPMAIHTAITSTSITTTHTCIDPPFLSSRLSRHHLSTLITTLRLIELDESSNTFVALAQQNAISVLLDVLREVATALNLSIRSKDDDIKRERQILMLASACLKVIYLASKKFLFSSVPISPTELKNILESLLQLYIALSRHPLFTLLHNSSALPSSGSSNSGYLPYLYKVSRYIVCTLSLFPPVSQGFSDAVFSTVMAHATDLPRNFFGGAHLLSNLLTLVPDNHTLIVPSLALDAYQEADSNEERETLNNNSSAPQSPSLRIRASNEPVDASVASQLTIFLANLGHCSSKLVYEQLCFAAQSFVSVGATEAYAVVSQIVDILATITSSTMGSPEPHRLSQNTHTITRLLHLLLVLCTTSNGRESFLQKKSSVGLLIQFLHLEANNREQEQSSKHLLFALSILHGIIMCLWERPVTTTQSEQIQAVVKPLYRLITFPLKDSSCVTTTSLHMLQLLASHQHTLNQFFLVSTQNYKGSNQHHQKRPPTLFFKLLKDFYSYLKSKLQLQQSPTTADQRANVTVEIPTIIAILKTLLVIMERVNSSQNSLATFVDSSYEPSDVPHPLEEISSCLQGLESIVANISLKDQLQQCHKEIHNILKCLSSSDEKSIQTTVSPILSGPLAARSTLNQTQVNLLDDSDFADLEAPSSEVVNEIQKVSVTTYGEDYMRQATETGSISLAGSTAEPALKKFKTTPPVGGVIIPATSKFRRVDPFRTRKPNTSRPPSTHVDNFIKKNQGSDNGISSSNKNIYDMLAMDAKNREMLKRHVGNAPPQEPQRPMGRQAPSNKRRLDDGNANKPPYYFNTTLANPRWDRQREMRDDRQYDKDKEMYKFPFSHPLSMMSPLSYDNDGGYSRSEFRGLERHAIPFSRGHPPSFSPIRADTASSSTRFDSSRFESGSSRLQLRPSSPPKLHHTYSTPSYSGASYITSSYSNVSTKRYDPPAPYTRKPSRERTKHM